MMILSVFLVFISYVKYSISTTERCRANCASPDRLVGPTRPANTRPHPWKIATMPTRPEEFCNMGCELFFTYYPKNSTCKSTCDHAYRYQVTVGYNDQAEEARLECHNGCDIALQICQAGYFCTKGEMKPCAPGTWRSPELGLVVHQCIDCPYGRWRSLDKGKSADDCTKCAVGKYLNATGATAESSCLRCPAGKTALEEGTRLCTCITPASCDLELQRDGEGVRSFYKNGVDYFRESVPYEGRW
mmetsp:Transcript_3662/g.3788  ORF Transcript_3662/g.3788 Transcript_3662/m.3788 type:complete len:245 (-) Transcript_3662:484-1218(-)